MNQHYENKSDLIKHHKALNSIQHLSKSLDYGTISENPDELSEASQKQYLPNWLEARQASVIALKKFNMDDIIINGH